MTRAAESSAGSRADWLSARAALAGRRSGRFTLGATATFLVVLLALLIIPQLGISVVRDDEKNRAVRRDTLAPLRALSEAQRAAEHADSSYREAVTASERPEGGRAELSSPGRRLRDSLQALVRQLDTLLDRSAKAPLPASYSALATSDAMRSDPRVRLLTDSLDLLEKRRVSIGPRSDAERSFADLTQQLSDVGLKIRTLTYERRTALARATTETPSASTPLPATDTARSREARDRARTLVTTLAGTLVAARANNDNVDRRELAARDRANHRVPPIAMLGAATVLAVMIGFSTTLFSEIGRPTVANSREAERVAGCPVVAMPRDTERTSRDGAIDPFRMLYLGLTATGTQSRTVVVCGDDGMVVATVAARLALAAAGDARATLVVDADSETSAVAGYFNQRPEPGFSDAIAGVRLWREVARPVGANDGLSLDMVPGGSIRRDETDVATLQLARGEFERFRDEYDFCVAVASSELAVQRISAIMDGPTFVLCGEIGQTTIEDFARQAYRLRESGAHLHGVVLWDAASPQLPTRNALMGRVVGGAGAGRFANS